MRTCSDKRGSLLKRLTIEEAHAHCEHAETSGIITVTARCDSNRGNHTRASRSAREICGNSDNTTSNVQKPDSYSRSLFRCRS
jgi:hypothetical protein